MAVLSPFRALRPDPAVAAVVASVPYDVVSTGEARALAHANPLSFLHVTRAEIDLSDSTSPYDEAVYAQAVRNFEGLKRAAPLVLDAEPSLYVYRLGMGTHVQTGVGGAYSLDEYDRGLIKKHEKTRRDKEDDRTRHIVDLRAQTGIVFLTHQPAADVTAAVARVCAGAPCYAFTAPDEVTHTVWRADGPAGDALVAAYAALPALYIADGHHRAASAARARTALAATADAPASRFLAVAFPDDQVQILAYNRVVRDLAGLGQAGFLAAVRARMPVAPSGTGVPAARGQVGMFVDGAWHLLSLPEAPAGAPHGDTLDVERLHQQVLAPVLGIGDVRADKRIDFVGGSRGTTELERLVTSGAAAVAFSMHPVAIGDLVAIADAGGIMPPKSTWFEPKLRDGLLVHLV
ncbi:MAG TPA: DUF1015 family protein [Vicinamibacterales bacterium]|nr:DUF1015 family protein [Vicinamibacterales bacterium]